MISNKFNKLKKNLNKYSCCRAFESANFFPVSVSVHCFVYNNENDFSKCINQILNQIVDFGVEIIVHDDNSTDSSKTLIEKYRLMYPNCIKPIFESTNVYSKTGNFMEIEKIMLSVSNGTFIALCEADDYWTSEYKLFFQYHLSQIYNESSFCVHKVIINDYKEKDNNDEFLPYFKLNSKLIDDKRFIKFISHKYCFQTSSYFFKKNILDAFYSNLPRYALLMPTDDEILLRCLGTSGKTIYINEAMSCYIKGRPGSWTEEKTKESKNESLHKKLRYIDAIDEFNKYTKGKYSKSCLLATTNAKLDILLVDKQYKTIMKDSGLRKCLFRRNLISFVSIMLKSRKM